MLWRWVDSDPGSPLPTPGSPPLGTLDTRPRSGSDLLNAVPRSREQRAGLFQFHGSLDHARFT